MSVFVDTSALYALLDADDANHAAARDAFQALADAELVTHAYVVVETLALVSRRLGREAVVQLIGDLLPVIQVEMVDAPLHGLALEASREPGAGGVSFVDRTSFAFMRPRGIERAFAFDADFERAGFEPVPGRA